MGRIVVFEGIDGSGKTTQVQLLLGHLQCIGYRCCKLSFPRYTENFFGAEVGKYLNGDFGDIEYNHPKLVSLLYSLDRFQSAKEVKELLENNDFLIFDRYIASNIAHQGSRLVNEYNYDKEEAFKAIKDWVEKVEYEILGVPRPDLTVFLNVPFNVTWDLIGERGEKRDLHESGTNHLVVAYEFYKKLAESDDWVTIDCARHIKERGSDSKSLIHYDIINAIINYKFEKRW